MLDYKKILFPVDLSGIGDTIVPHVKTISDKFGAEVRLMFVAKVNEYYVDGEEPGVSIKKKVNEYKNEHFKEILDAQVVVTDGDPGDEILRYIDAEDIDLVIMATRGRTALDKAIFGSVAHKVAKVAPVPVFLINPFKDKFIHR
ncbi:MAG: universal stress protein [Proteobacteria bacterium]|nr:universal stress protein [Pseudomonadota bacterium]